MIMTFLNAPILKALTNCFRFKTQLQRKKLQRKNRPY